ncbi:MAG: S8 family peptidase [Bacteroidetes bacterium]|nr:S8 family peptidase [Bacteroidota bacterium]MCW5896813.1 S8 family peptidase [Bacteroidota bacterium]
MKTISLILLLCGAFSAFSQSSRIDFRFDFLKRQAEAAGQVDVPVSATIRFSEKPDEALLQLVERSGVRFVMYNGKRLGSETVFPVEVTFDDMQKLDRVHGIIAVQPSWRPVRVPPLDVSRPQIQADTVWQRNDQLGRKITGKGAIIADFDTGVDFFHPMLFFADGDTLNWLDVNSNSVFDPGTDAVDLNGNGIADPGEILRYREISYSGNTGGVYDVNLDFLYNDANNDGTRNSGTGAGFTEASPTYGEQWFIALDANGNNRLNVGEKLVGLKTSKIRAIRETSGVVRRRGIDLINANPDTGPYGGHGTSVAGIAVGGIEGVHRLAGIAPGADMIFGSIEYNNTPRFFTGLAAMMAWAAAEGADVFLVEDGEWVWEYLDGSSNEEIMINEYAANGIVQVMPAGNLTGGFMQKTVTVNASDSTTITFTGGSSSQVWPSVRWMGNASDVTVSLQVASSSFVPLPGDGSTITIGTKSVYSNKGTSSRNTTMMAVYIASSGSTTYNLRVVNTSGTAKRIDCMLGDNGFSWSGLARWSSPSEDNTATWPSTADSAIGVGAYKNKSNDTNINTFSGKGTRLDGFRIVDVASPGSTVYTIGRNVTYTGFGGTSSAGPHVAGAAALLLQADTTLRHRHVKALLQAGAIADQYTGTVPNTTWGFGKLRIANSLNLIVTDVTGIPELPAAFILSQNYPNPFNPTTNIKYQIPNTNHVTLKVFDLLGREVATLVDEVKTAGEYAVQFNTSGLASGVYFYRLSIPGSVATRKMMVVK